MHQEGHLLRGFSPWPAGSPDPGTFPPLPTSSPLMTATIARILGIDTARARLVRGYLQLEHRTLDSLSAAQIKREYREIGPAIDADSAMADRVASSFGL